MANYVDIDNDFAYRDCEAVFFNSDDYDLLVYCAEEFGNSIGRPFIPLDEYIMILLRSSNDAV